MHLIDTPCRQIVRGMVINERQYLRRLQTQPKCSDSSLQKLWAWQNK